MAAEPTGAFDAAPVYKQNGHHRASSAVSLVESPALKPKRIAVFGMGYVGCVSSRERHYNANGLIGVGLRP